MNEGIKEKVLKNSLELVVRSSLINAARENNIVESKFTEDDIIVLATNLSRWCKRAKKRIKLFKNSNEFKENIEELQESIGKMAEYIFTSEISNAFARNFFYEIQKLDFENQSFGDIINCLINIFKMRGGSYL